MESGPESPWPIRFGRYQLHRRLASGGMAEIFLARQEGIQGFAKTVVIKRILPHLSGNRAFVEMFLDEARIAAKLTHSNIIQVFDFGFEEGSYFLAMEYVAGETLRGLLRSSAKRRLPVPVGVAVRVIGDACDGLHFAHTLRDDDGTPLNVVHRDISPSNLMVTCQGSVKVLDFGIAKAEGRLTETAGPVVKGKYRYMSPEQLASRPIDQRSDVFALGILLHELLTGRKLFDGENDLAVMRAILEDEIPPPSTLRTDVASDLDEIVLKALARDRAQRYPDARSFGRALEAFLIHQSDTASVRATEAWVTDLLGEEEVGKRTRPWHGSVLDAGGSSSMTPLPPAGVDPTGVPTAATPPRGAEPTGGAAAPTVGKRVMVALRVAGTAVVAVLAVAGALALMSSSSSPTEGDADGSLAEDETAAAHPGESGGTEPSEPMASPVEVRAGTQAESPEDVQPAAGPEGMDPSSAGPEDMEPTPAVAETQAVEETVVPEKAATTRRNRPRRRTSGSAPGREAAATRPAPRAYGTLDVNCMPWCRIYIDGRDTEQNSPARGIRLPVGRHVIRAHNPPTGREETREIEIRAGEATRVAFRLE